MKIFQCYSMAGCAKRWGLTRTDLKETISLLVYKIGGSSILGVIGFPGSVLRHLVVFKGPDSLKCLGRGCFEVDVGH